MNQIKEKPILVVMSLVNLFKSFGQVPGLNNNLFAQKKHYSSIFKFKEELSSYDLSRIYVVIIEDGLASNGFNLEWLAGGLKTFLPKSYIYKIKFIEGISDINTTELLINHSYFESRVTQPFDYIFLNKINPSIILRDIKKNQ